jgi:hypothetical protein
MAHAILDRSLARGVNFIDTRRDVFGARQGARPAARQKPSLAVGLPSAQGLVNKLVLGHQSGWPCARHALGCAQARA